MPTLSRGHSANRSATVGASAQTIRAGDAGGPSQLFRCADLHPVGRRFGCQSAAAVVAHTGEKIAERQGALTLTLGAVRLVRVFSA